MGGPGLKPERQRVRCRPGLLACLARAYLLGCFAALLAALVLIVKGCLRRPPQHGRPDGAHTIPDWAFREPDPLIYSQYWLGSPSTLQAGQAVVGLALKPGQAPATLRPGTRVEVIDTVKPTNAGDQPRPVVLTASAFVAPLDGAAQAKPSANGITLVSLTMPAADAPAVAAAAMDGRVSLVVLPSAP